LIPHIRASPPVLSMWPCTGNVGWSSSLKSSESTGRLLKPWNILQISEPRNGLITQSNRIYWRFPFSDWLDSLIGPSGLLLVPFQVPTTWSTSFNFMGGVGKKVITRTWMWEIFLQGHILRADAVTLVFTFLVATNLVSCIPPTFSNHLEFPST
jgi:hypothetical protein